MLILPPPPTVTAAGSSHVRKGCVRPGCRLRCGESLPSRSAVTGSGRSWAHGCSCPQVPASGCRPEGRSRLQWKSDSDPSILLAINRQTGLLPRGVFAYVCKARVIQNVPGSTLPSDPPGWRTASADTVPLRKLGFYIFPARTFSTKWPGRLPPVRGAVGWDQATPVPPRGPYF